MPEHERTHPMNTEQNPILTERKSCRTRLSILALIVLTTIPFLSNAQAVTEVITDYNGYWKTSSTSINPVKPDNHHNLLSFSFSGTRYSTGVNDALLTSHGETFNPSVFRALPLQNVNGTLNGNTKIGLGAMVDGVYNGPGTAPSRSIAPYLNDGVNGLDMGTCIANLPSGTMFMSVSNILTAEIGDGVPDILVTQIADPSTSHDIYEFTDVNGVRIGNQVNIVLNNITPVGNWVADFYEATGTTILTSGYTQTQRAVRLWAADLSSFGLNASNVANVAYFKITLSGVSDIAFVAYNAATITVQQVLDLPGENDNRISRVVNREEIKSLSVYPNPATAVVNFSHPKAISNDKILIYNFSGVMLRQVTPSISSTRTSIDISSLKPGTYQALYIGDGKKFSQKFIVR